MFLVLFAVSSVFFLFHRSHSICVIAADISPIDVISHLPVYCEENDIPYIFVPSKVDLGAAASTKRPTSCVLAQTLPDDAEEKVKEKWTKAIEEINALATSN